MTGSVKTVWVVSPMVNTRLLKAHVDAVEDAWGIASWIGKETHDRRAVAECLALAAITATDNKPSFVAVVLEGGHQYLYGEFKSYNAARKAIDKGVVGTTGKARGYVAPLIPAPKLKTLGDVEEYLYNDREWD